LKPSYWCTQTSIVDDNDYIFNNQQRSRKYNDAFEKEPQGLKASVKIKGLTKVKKKKKRKEEALA
jgi:hypothetical protein